MAKLSKKMAIAVKKVDSNKLYDLTEAMKLVKEVNLTKFDSSVDLHKPPSRNRKNKKSTCALYS
jgi:large subunit ribosomal protein L1